MNIWNHQFSKTTTDLYARNMFTECVWQILNFKHFSLPDTEKLNFWFDKFVKLCIMYTQTEVNIFPASFSHLEPLWASPWAATIFFFKRIMTLHQGNSCSLFQNGHQVIKKARWPCHQMTSCKLMCYCCYLRDLFGWIIFQGNKRHMVIADWAMVD